MAASLSGECRDCHLADVHFTFTKGIRNFREKSLMEKVRCVGVYTLW